MNNFGVIELAATKTTNAPGWAYVPDTTPNIAAAAASSLQPGNRKRAARNQATASTSVLYADADARQEAKLRREIDALDRDNYHRDVTIPIVSRTSNKNVKKHTANVRKILQSQKTFANHLDDFEALQGTEKAGSSTHTHTHATPAIGDAATRASAGGSKKGGATAQKEREREQQQQQQQKNKKSSKSTSRSASISKATPTVKQEEDVEMADAPPHDEAAGASSSPQRPHSSILAPYTRPGYPPSHPLDTDPLLVSRVPPLPTDAQLKELLRGPPLSYAEARGRWTESDRRYPPRVFCEVCGYWGRVRCMKCGVRVCALECLETHREECVTRYGL
ncbi:hypothetical protein F5Y13DRAFT_98490 [Hypoxylon sp. FL1857]|nr:hypothetical protein F5Y13DRAFT_98490 [Hypoxylon sp. FL1857]